MNQSLYFLATAWMAAQGVNAPPASLQPMKGVTYVQPQQQAVPYPVQAQPIPAPERRGLLPKLTQKISGLFSKKPAQTQPPMTEGVRIIQPQQPGSRAEPPLATDPGRVQLDPRGMPVTQTAHSVAQAAAQVKKAYAEKIGHEDDYSWVTGQLHCVHTVNGPVWLVRYATVDTEDRYGGSVVLASTVNMRNYREGDLVSVRGEILDGGRAVRNLGGPLYRATSINIIERAD